jgi:hypothetical protein
MAFTKGHKGYAVSNGAKKPAGTSRDDDKPIHIEPQDIYDFRTARVALRIKGERCLPREVRERRLRFSVRRNKVFFLGAWLIEWVATGERKKKKPVPVQASLDNMELDRGKQRAEGPAS